METGRLFAAVSFTGSERQALAQLSAELKGCCAAGRMSRAELLHITLHFFGETELARAEAIGRAMARAAAAHAPFPLTTGRAGTFRGGVLWLGVAAGAEELRGLQASLEAALAGEGFPPEGRPFRAHITLGRDVRLRPGVDPAALVLPPVALRVNGLTLLRSTQASGRLEYLPLLHAPLGRG